MTMFFSLMHISSIIPFFKKNEKKLTSIDSILIKKLKSLESQNNLSLFIDVKVYHHHETYPIELLLFDKLRGIYLFERKQWTYKELKKSVIQKAQKQESTKNTLAFDKTHKIIEKKLSELTNRYDIPIYNYLLMENLNANEYEHLDDSFKELLPHNRIIFSDTTLDTIIEKLENIHPDIHPLDSCENILNNLLIQYTLLTPEGASFIATPQQRAFIDNDIQGLVKFSGLHGSGKSSSILLKAIVELLDKKSENIIIIKPTLLACDIFKNRLLEIIEHAIIEVDLTSITIVTPEKFKQETLHPKSLIICDDADILESEFIEHLTNSKKIRRLLLVQNSSNITETQLTTNFRKQTREVHFYKTEPHTKALQLITEFTNTKAKNVLVVSNILSREKLKDAMDSFFEKNYKILESDVPLANQKYKNILLTTYKDINEIDTQHIILMDIPFLSKNEIEYAFNLANKTVDVLYEEDCEEIRHLRKINEDN